ncbi:MAG: ABC transporter ATP-binding protein [Patescibacteria group bacterium]
MNVLQVDELTKKFGDFTAVDAVSFSLGEGEILGFLGRNGAGKTTTIQMLLGVLTPTSGAVNYFGKDLSSHHEEIMEQVNFSSTYTNLPWDLSVQENLTFISYLFDIPNRKKRIAKIAHIFKIERLLKEKMANLSAGQLTRVNLAKSFINYPRVLLLDEPTASLDPEVATYIRSFLIEERKNFQVSILLTSHNMREVEEVCDRVIFIDHGKVVADDTPYSLARTVETSHIDFLIKDGLKRLEEYVKKIQVSYEIRGRYIKVSMKEKEIGMLLKEMATLGIEYDEISIDKPDLEDYFLEKLKEHKTA